MHLEVFRTLAEFDALADEWNSLLAFSASDVPFLRHEFLRNWWTTMGGGEWSRGELYVVSGRSPEGLLLGIAPLFFTENRDHEPALLFLGSVEIADYLDLIVCPEHLPAFVEALLENLNSHLAPAWKVLDLYNLQDRSASLPVLSHAAARRDWSFTLEALQHCPYISLPGDWQAYLDSLDKKQRHEIRRKIRRLEQSDMQARWYIHEDGYSLGQELEAFLALMAKDPAKEKFLTGSMRKQIRESARAAFDSDSLQLAFLEVNGEKVAGYLNFDYAGRIWVYNSGLNPEYRELSPGWVLLAYLIRWANENKRREFDFLRGNEDYKYRFGATDRRVVRAKVIR